MDLEMGDVKGYSPSCSHLETTAFESLGLLLEVNLLKFLAPRKNKENDGDRDGDGDQAS